VAWLFPYLPYASALEIGDVGAFCALDPPAFSVPTAAQILSFLTGGVIGDYLTVNEFIKNIVRYYLWFKLCQCTSGATPSPSTGPSVPTGAPVLNPPAYVQPPSSIPCGATTQVGPSAITTGTTKTLGGEFNITSQSRTYPFSLSNPLGPWQNYTGGVCHVNNTPQALGTHGAIIVSVETRSSTSGTNHETAEVTIANNGSADIPFTLPFGDVLTGVWFRLVTGTNSQDIDVQFTYYCGSAPGGLATPCCGPDPQITGLLGQIASLLTLVQRQAAPFGYVYGTNHTGLTGTGSISVADLIGVSVDVTTTPGYIGEEAGTPIELFGIGFITLGTTDGYETSRRIDHDGTLFLPHAAGVYTTIGYTLNPGVVVDIRELVREP